MKAFTCVCTLAVLFSSCSSSTDSAAQRCLSRYQTFVDSIYTQNERWRKTTDTDFIEMPYDPSNPALVRIDTVVTPPESKTTLLMDEFLGTPILNAYHPLKMEVDIHIAQMDEKMKQEYEISRQKFESMMAK